MKRSLWRVAIGAIGLVLALWLGGPTYAAPLSPELQTQLLALYHRWASLLGDGKLAEAAAISAPDLRKQIADTMKNKDETAQLAAMAKAMTPDTIEPKHAAMSKDGKQAFIIALSTSRVPLDAKVPPDGPKPGSIVQGELTLKFERQGTEWKFVEQDFGPGPADIKACHDDATETLGSYDKSRSQNAGGPIARVEFKADHTLVVFRIVDEENCAILPTKEELAKGGFNVSLLTPYTLIEIDGFPHKSDKQRMWADKFHIVQDD
jgi:hypothetical protein